MTELPATDLAETERPATDLAETERPATDRPEGAAGAGGFRRLLVVTAVEAERQAVLDGIAKAPAGRSVGGGSRRFEVVAVGVGPAAAAATTALLLAGASPPFEAVICAGIAGGFGELVEVGGLAVASASIAADLGASSPDGFIGLDELGFGTARRPAEPALLAALRAELPGAVEGPVLSVSTVTGTAEQARALRTRHPDAVAEAMEGFGVATAAALAGVPFGEVRSISNLIGPRDRSAWRIALALDALREAFGRLA
jgi:futalosine hydrolase